MNKKKIILGEHDISHFYKGLDISDPIKYVTSIKKINDKVLDYIYNLYSHRKDRHLLEFELYWSSGPTGYTVILTIFKYGVLN